MLILTAAAPAALQLLLATITIMTDDFEWDRTEAAANYKKHGVRFEHAVLAFEDPFAVVELDESEEYGEARFLLTGRAAGGSMVGVSSELGDWAPSMSAREPQEHSSRTYHLGA